MDYGALPSFPEEDTLWERLLAGRVSEVCVVGAPISEYLPQTLGLEPIVFDAYHYTPDGRHRPPAELDQIAAQLAASRRWITGWPAPQQWLEPFLERAEAILFMNFARDSGYVSRDVGVNTGPSTVRTLGSLLRRRGGRHADDDYFEEIIRTARPAPRPGRRRNPVPESITVQFASKLLTITTHDQLRQLRRVRALPAPREGA